MPEAKHATELQKAALAALRTAARKAIAKHERAGLPVVVRENGNAKTPARRRNTERSRGTHS